METGVGTSIEDRVAKVERLLAGLAVTSEKERQNAEDKCAQRADSNWRETYSRYNKLEAKIGEEAVKRSGVDVRLICEVAKLSCRADKLEKRPAKVTIAPPPDMPPSGVVFQIVIPGDPVAKASPRAFVNPRTGRPIITNSPKTKKAMDRFCAVVSQHIPEKAIQDPVRVKISAFFSVPKSKPKWWGAAAEAGHIPHTTKPDADNLVKLILDCLCRLSVLGDDRQVAELSISKRYSESPRTEISIALLPTIRTFKAWKTRTR